MVVVLTPIVLMVVGIPGISFLFKHHFQVNHLFPRHQSSYLLRFGVGCLFLVCFCRVQIPSQMMALDV